MSLQVLERSAELDRNASLPRLSRSAIPHSRAWVAVLVATDILVFCTALFLGNLIVYGHHHSGFSVPKVVLFDAGYVALWLIIFERLGLYRKTAALSVKDELYFTVTALTIGIIPQLLLFTLVPAISASRMVLLLALGFSILGAALTRTGLRALRESGAFRRQRRVAIVGSMDRAEQVCEAMDVSRESTILIPITNLDRDCDGGANGDPTLSNIPWLNEAFSRGCDTIIFTEIPSPVLIPRLLEVAALRQVRIAFAPPRIRQQSYALSLEIDGHQALIVPERLKACTPRARLAKRMMDLVLAPIALAVFSPVMLICAAAILIEDGRPIFYRQERVGLNGRVFEILKFRSMCLDAERQTGAVWVRKDDDRRTRVGAIMRRFSFDELPQFFNVLKGDMSLVGPRPERPTFVESFRASYPHYDERHLVRPGITALSHMKMHRLVDANDIAMRLTFDLYYLEEWSLFMDISLLIRTAAEFLFQRAG